MVRLRGIAIILFLTSSQAQAQDAALLLFDSETHQQFVGCLNCSRYDNGSVCNRYGDYGSRYSELSIWNSYGKFGSRYEDNSPWNRFGQGLIVVDPEGNFYGIFSLNRNARYTQSRVPLVQDLLELYEAGVELDQIRDLLCE
jgi:hypothetical protein